MRKTLIAICLVALLLVVAGCGPKEEPATPDTAPGKETPKMTPEEGPTPEKEAELDVSSDIGEVSEAEDDLSEEELEGIDSDLDSIEEALM